MRNRLVKKTQVWTMEINGDIDKILRGSFILGHPLKENLSRTYQINKYNYY